MSLGDITSGPGAVFTNTTNPPVTADVQRPCRCGGRFGVVGTGCATWCPGPTESVPVTTDVQRELNPRDRLAAGLVFDAGFAATTTEARAAADALLADGGAVQLLIADAEKRAAAAAARDAARAVSGNMRMLSALLVRQIRSDRAAALDPAGAASGETT